MRETFVGDGHAEVGGMDSSKSSVVRSYEHAGLRLVVDRRQDGSTRIEVTALATKKATRRRTPNGIVVALVAVFLSFGRSLLFDGWSELLSKGRVQGLPSLWTILAVCVLALLGVLSWPGPIIGESILVIRDLGLQHGVIRRNPLLQLASKTFGWSNSFSRQTQSLLIARDEIMDVVVHETFRRWTIGSFVAILTVSAEHDNAATTAAFTDDGEEVTKFALQPGGHGGVVVLFPHFSPPLKLVQIAYTEIHRTLF